MRMSNVPKTVPHERASSLQVFSKTSYITVGTKEVGIPTAKEIAATSSQVHIPKSRSLRSM